MALFKTIDLVEYVHRLELQQSTLHLSLVFNETEKKDVAIIYQELIAICDKAIDRQIPDIEVKEYTSFLAVN
jgi:N-dimethylarginine dimethylaminohydrolase